MNHPQQKWKLSLKQLSALLARAAANDEKEAGQHNTEYVYTHFAINDDGAYYIEHPDETQPIRRELT